MSIEIERRFLVDRLLWEAEKRTEGTPVMQGYLFDDPAGVLRIRVAGEQGFLTIKGKTESCSRPEFEFEIPKEEALHILEVFTPPRVEKTRYQIPWKGKTWEVDVFSGANTGLILAEIELKKEDEPFDRPPWLKTEVTLDPRFMNSNLAKQPWTTWS